MKWSAYLVMTAALVASGEALALGAITAVNLIDPDSGEVLNAHYYHGEYWVAGRPGVKYAIEIRNRTGGRLLAVTSVDGVNVLSGETADWGQAGYVFEPGQRYQISGWRKSNTEVAAFTFTDLAGSYAARTGRPENVGVIGVAVFREQPQPRLLYTPPKLPQLDTEPSAPRSGSDRAGSLAGVPGLGTGHGEREYSYVTDTEFRRMRAEPNEIVRIRYDSLDNLVAMGIVRRARATPPWPNPFPRSRPQQFVPDPPG